MLSGETSVGEYPVVTVQTMARIVDNTESHGLEQVHVLVRRRRVEPCEDEFAVEVLHVEPGAVVTDDEVSL